ncbi:hypothetical protein LZ32DRAFT_607878 [Colletotrichum eremochloae]|nr:hypothetical protein LZ32DRAFT_607878 [Colletotrichum eremochloae]
MNGWEFDVVEFGWALPLEVSFTLTLSLPNRFFRLEYTESSAKSQPWRSGIGLFLVVTR